MPERPHPDPRDYPQRRPPRPPEEPTTLGGVHKRTRWVWIYCSRPGCGHSSPMALAPLVIRWGADAPLERLLRSARCMMCERRGAEIRHPSWGDSVVGFQPFPAERYPAPFRARLDPFKTQRTGKPRSMR